MSYRKEQAKENWPERIIINTGAFIKYCQKEATGLSILFVSSKGYTENDQENTRHEC